MPLILDGKSVSMKFFENIKLEIENSRLCPEFEIIYVSNDPASEIFFNKDDSINGIIVQSPIPDIEDQNFIFDKIIPQREVDGFSTINIGKL